MCGARLLRIALLAAAGWSATGLATEVSFPPLASDGTTTGTAASTVTVQLVDAAGKPMIGLRTTDGAPVTTYLSHDIPADGAAWVVDLTPQSAIARPDAAASYYAIEIRAAHRREPYRVQVPDSATVQELADLVGGAAVDPADIVAGRLIPPGGTTGQVLAKDTDVDFAVEWVTGGGVSHDPVTVADSTSIDLTLTGQQVSAAAIFGSDAGTVAQGNHTHLTENIAPASMVVEYGTLDSGTVADLAAADGTVVAISEVTGTPALQVVLTYTGVTTFNEVRAYLRYAGSATHYLALEVYDYVGADWEQYGTIATSAESAWYFWTIADPSHHVSGGQAQVRIRHIQSGVTSHDLYLDLVGLSSAVEGGTIAHPDLTGRSVADAHPASAITNTPAGNIAATTVQAAINELDTDKLATGSDAADLTSGAAADGYALVADGAGGAAWEAVSGGSGHDAVTLAGTPDYITLTDQVITRNAVDLAADVTGTLPVANGGTGRTAGVSEDVQTFTTSGTWTKPSGGQTRCEIFVVGAGGGGGTGRVGATSQNANGGTGGAGGAAVRVGYDLSAFGATVSVTIGAGGAGGAAVTTDSTNGNAGSAGGDTSFGSIVAPGGAAGLGGTNLSTGVIGPLGSVGYPAISGAGSTANVALGFGVTAPASPLGGGGGGGGGGLSAANILRVGSAGAAGSPGYLASLIAGGAIGTSGGFAGGAGDPASDASAVEANATGAGGGGGHAVTTADSGAGGAGGYPGGGGGGAGAARDGYDTGAGGDGANGYVRVRCW